MRQGESILCNTTDILRNLAAYALFAGYGVGGYFLLYKRVTKENAPTV